MFYLFIAQALELHLDKKKNELFYSVITIKRAWADCLDTYQRQQCPLLSMHLFPYNLARGKCDTLQGIDFIRS